MLKRLRCALAIGLLTTAALHAEFPDDTVEREACKCQGCGKGSGRGGARSNLNGQFRQGRGPVGQGPMGFGNGPGPRMGFGPQTPQSYGNGPQSFGNGPQSLGNGPPQGFGNGPNMFAPGRTPQVMPQGYAQPFAGRGSRPDFAPQVPGAGFSTPPLN